MRLMFWRRKDDAPATLHQASQQTPQSATATATVLRPERAPQTGRVAPTRETTDAMLRFAQDYLAASGARVQVEEDDVLAVTLLSGERRRYTTSLARARADEEMTLLVEGGAALALLLDECAARGRVSGLRLFGEGDALRMAGAAWAAPAQGCGRCVGHGGEVGAHGRPTCAVCPLREGRPVLQWADAVPAPVLLGLGEEIAIECTFTVTTHDRRGRTDEVVRRAYDLTTRAPRALLDAGQLTRAQAVPLDEATVEQSGAALRAVQETLAPALEAAAAFLSARSVPEYSRRVEDVTATHDRLRRESPELGREVDAMLSRELDALLEVFGVEVDARLDRVCFVRSPSSRVGFPFPGGGEVRLTVDFGRGTTYLPACAACGNDLDAGHVCARGHLVCVHCASHCGTCEHWACPLCAETFEATCASCATPLCDECAHACERCGAVYCRDHLWACVEGDQTLCIGCVELCSACGATACMIHTHTCNVCSDVLCPEHTRSCSACQIPLCERHAQTCTVCGAVLCSEHALTCDACGAVACAADTVECPGCGRRLCACSPLGACTSCQSDYCAACRAEDESCPACRALAPADEAALAVLALTGDAGAALREKKKVLAGRNARSLVFVARGLGRQTVLVVAPNGTVLHSYRKGWGR